MHMKEFIKWKNNLICFKQIYQVMHHHNSVLEHFKLFFHLKWGSFVICKICSIIISFYMCMASFLIRRFLSNCYFLLLLIWTCPWKTTWKWISVNLIKVSFKSVSWIRGFMDKYKGGISEDHLKWGHRYLPSNFLSSIHAQLQIVKVFFAREIFWRQ